jgi:hypothetical protein
MARPRDRKRQLPIQGKFSRSSKDKEGDKPCLDPTMTQNPWSKVGHFSMENPGQFSAQINS